MRTIAEIRAIMRHDLQIMGHEFVQDPDDIEGGCKTCWEYVGELDAD